MSVESAPDAVPEIVMGWKNFTCPTCYASVYAYADIYAEHFEDLPEQVELHMQWHDRNDRR